MGKTPPIITYHEAKFVSSSKPVKRGKVRASKIQLWDKHRIDILVSKEKNRKKGKRDGFQESPKPSTVNSIKS